MRRRSKMEISLDLYGRRAGKTYATGSILNHQNKRTARGQIGGRAFVIQSCQTDAVLLKTICQRPGINELQSRRK